MRWIARSLGTVAALAGAATASAGTPPSYLTFIANSRTVHPTVELAQSSGGAARTLGPGGDALIAPDGNSVAAIQTLPPQGNATSELVIYPTGGGRAVKLDHFNGFATLLGWSADSKLLLVDGPGATSSSATLLVVDAATGGSRRIASGDIQGASFAPNSSNDVAYSRASSMLLTATPYLYETTPSGASTHEIASDASNPVWGLHFIVFARTHSRGSQLAPISQLWSVPPGGGTARQLTHIKVGPLATGLFPVAISADGKHLLADYSGTDQSNAWVVDLSGATPVAHQLGGGETIANAISRDGSSVLFSTGFEGTPPSVEAIPFTGGTPSVLAAHGFAGSWNR